MTEESRLGRRCSALLLLKKEMKEKLVLMRAAIMVGQSAVRELSCFGGRSVKEGKAVPFGR